MLFRGTTLIQHGEDALPQASPLARSKHRPPGGGLICEVLRTGFSTTQGESFAPFPSSHHHHHHHIITTTTTIIP